MRTRRRSRRSGTASTSWPRDANSPASRRSWDAERESSVGSSRNAVTIRSLDVVVGTSMQEVSQTTWQTSAERVPPLQPWHERASRGRPRPPARRDRAARSSSRAIPAGTAHARPGTSSPTSIPPSSCSRAAPEDVTATVRFAREHGLRVAPQSTGHGAPSLGDLAGTILLRTAAAERRDDRPGGAHGPGAGRRGLARRRRGGRRARPRRAARVLGRRRRRGLHARRRHRLARRASEGFASTHVRSFDVVTAVGNQLHVDAEREPDLYWALRGGGGGPVVVTVDRARAVPAAARRSRARSCGRSSRRARSCTATASGSPSVPDTLTSTVRLMRFPPLPELPEPLRGKRARLDHARVHRQRGSRATSWSRRCARSPRPTSTRSRCCRPARSAASSGDPPGPLPGIGNAVLLESFTPEVADAFVELGGPGRRQTR